jgi:hypothetical protein
VPHGKHDAAEQSFGGVLPMQRQLRHLLRRFPEAADRLMAPRVGNEHKNLPDPYCSKIYLPVRQTFIKIQSWG